VRQKNVTALETRRKTKKARKGLMQGQRKGPNQVRQAGRAAPKTRNEETQTPTIIKGHSWKGMTKKRSLIWGKVMCGEAKRPLTERSIRTSQFKTDT